MKKLFLKITPGDPLEYYAKEKEWDIVFVDFKSCVIWASVVINGTLVEEIPQIIVYIYNKMIKPTGKIILRMDMPDLHKKKGGDKLKLLLHKLVEKDSLEFMAQCVVQNSKIPVPIVENLLVGISKKKHSELKNTVRFISVPDKLEIKTDYDWPLFDGNPFSYDIINEYSKYSDVSNRNILDLHPWLYLPLNNLKNSDSIKLGTFMELTPSTIEGKVKHGLNYEKFVINKVKMFDLHQSYVVNKNEKFADKNKPYYKRKIINKSSILFSTHYRSGIKTLLFLNPEYPIFIDHPTTNDMEHKFSIQIKKEWNTKVDIEFIYLETRKPEFLSQFYYYKSPFNSTLTLKSSTVLQAKIKNLPSIQIQKEIVKKEKEKLFNTQETKLALQKKLLNFEKEKLAYENRLADYSKKMLTLKKEIVKNNIELQKTIDACASLLPSRQKEAIGLLYDILPLKICFDEETTCPTKGFGNKARIIIECVMHTLKGNNTIPSWYDNGSSISFICREKDGWSNQISKELRHNLQEVKFITNKYSHEGTDTPINDAKKVLITIIQLLQWLKEFLIRNNNMKENFLRWVKDDEQETFEGLRKRTGVIGVIANEWINKQGKRKGAWIIPFKTETQVKTGKGISVSQKMIDEMSLGLGSILKIDAIKSNYGWECTKIEVINNCPKSYVLSNQALQYT